MTMKKIPGYEGLYSITDSGRVYSHRQNVWMKQFQGRGNYLQVVLTKDGEQRCFRIHRLVANVFIPPVENKVYVNHKNSQRDDNRVENLEWCTMRENVIHGWKQGRKAIVGSRHPHSKLTEDQVDSIRTADVSVRGSISRLAEHYGVKHSVISSIRSGRAWRVES